MFMIGFTLTTSFSHAQESITLGWAKTMGAAGDDLGRVVRTDAAGNVYTTRRILQYSRL
jgi:endo-1,4-beta-D-glucanase Y